MREATIDGLRIAYQRAGSGAPLVLLHGFICDSRVWEPQIDDLSYDFDVIAWDCPGCGRSQDPPEDYSMAQFADLLADFLDAIGVEEAHLLGLSWGGICILEFYRLYPGRVRSAILADTYAGWAGSLGDEAAAQRLERSLSESKKPAGDWIPDWVPAAFSRNAPRAMLDNYATIMRDFHPAGFRTMSRACAPDFSHVLPTIRVPTLLVWGDDDGRSPLSIAETFRDAVPDSRLVVIPNAGHVSNIEQPAAFNAEVRSFLRLLG